MSTPSLDANTATIRRKPPARRPVRVPREGPLNPEQSVEALRRDLLAGRPWYPALLKVVGRWSVAEEMVGDRLCRYLIEGEAFDWLLLAQRLISEVEDLIPADDVERLLLFGVAPPGHSEESFARAIGGPKHRAHLNYQYGVTVEELLLLSAELELQEGRPPLRCRSAATRCPGLRTGLRETLRGVAAPLRHRVRHSHYRADPLRRAAALHLLALEVPAATQ